MEKQTILITGGSGFIGQHLSALFRENNYPVAILSRNHNTSPGRFHWDPDHGELDVESLKNTGTIIHLAGASIGEGRWTKKHKQILLESRVKGARLLYEKLKANPFHVHTFISASAVGYYGNSGFEWVDEESPAGTDFLAETCRQWEAEVDKISSLGIRVVRMRTGLVLAADKGILPVMAKPVKWCAGAVLGTGLQYMSWIHINDLGRIYLMALENEKLLGPCNAVAPQPETNRVFTKVLARSLHRPLLFPPVPGLFLKLFMGEKADLVLHGQRVACNKLIGHGYRFEFTGLEDALSDLMP
jgi:uncharacterized protein (TIGR01777 family)